MSSTLLSMTTASFKIVASKTIVPLTNETTEFCLIVVQAEELQVSSLHRFVIGVHYI